MNLPHEPIPPRDSVEMRITTNHHVGYDSLKNNLMQLIHPTNPYENFDFKSIPYDIQGWNGTFPIFNDLINKIKPKVVVEVGTWKGQSAITMAKELRHQQIDGKVVCVDTWLGSLDSWIDHGDSERSVQMKRKNGFPTYYYQFLSNVMHENLQDYIVPFPQPSLHAAKWFKLLDIQPDLIYIDGSHDEHDVYYDLVNWYEVLKVGGIMFGDDIHWSGPRNALLRFCNERNLTYTMGSEYTWILEAKK